MVGKCSILAVGAVFMLATAREAEAQRPAAIGVSATVLAFARPDTLRTQPLAALPTRLDVQPQADTVRARRRPRVVVAYTGV